MRFHFILPVVVIVSLAGVCAISIPVEAQSYYGGAVYYSAPQVVYYETYRPIYYPQPIYYGRPVYYSYYSPSCVYYEMPVYYESSPSYERSDSSSYSSRRPSPAKPSTISTVGTYDNRFTPANLNVQPGTTVRWVNYGQHNHTITANDGSWDSGDIKPGASYSATFNTRGTYHYYCRHHTQDRMQGVVVVGSATGNGDGNSRSSGY
jgi:plastocyanin